MLATSEEFAIRRHRAETRLGAALDQLDKALSSRRDLSEAPGRIPNGHAPSSKAIAVYTEKTADDRLNDPEPETGF